MSVIEICLANLGARGDPDHGFVRAVAYTSAMISRKDVAVIRAEIERLQRAHRE